MSYGLWCLLLVIGAAILVLAGVQLLVGYFFRRFIGSERGVVRPSVERRAHVTGRS